jgi:hypothetical protein
LAVKRKIEELEDDPLSQYKKMSKKEKLEMVKKLIYLKKLKEQDGNEEPDSARAAKMEVQASSSRSISSPSNKRVINVESSKKQEMVEDKKPEAVQSASKPKSVTYAMPKSVGPPMKPTPFHLQHQLHLQLKYKMINWTNSRLKLIQDFSRSNKKLEMIILIWKIGRNS